jgi:23S rRNA pseudouridine2604 synthase
VLTQDPRLLRRMREDATRLEQEFNVEVAGEIAPYGLRRLAHGLAYQGRTLPPGKVSWQNETRLRFALKDVRAGQIAAVCAEVGLDVVSIKRIRIGRVPLAKMPVGEWRYLPASERL